MNVLAFDLSLTATGVAHTDGRPDTLKCRHTGMERLAWFREQVTGLVLAERPEVVVVEGYSFGSHDAGSRAIGELGGVVRLALWDLVACHVDVAPKSLKKFATGKGNAPKDSVMLAAARHGFAGDDNNAADAFWLRQMALYHYEFGDVPTTSYRTDAVANVEWPTLTKEAA